MSSAIDYAGMLRDAGRDVVRRVLARVAEEGLPGEHHFYVSFDTTRPDVEMAPGLRRVHPQTMTIVLQHQFWELDVDDEAFSVTVRFGARYERLRVPFAALTAFLDPSAELGLNFVVPEEAAEEAADEGGEPPRTEAAAEQEREEEGSDNVLRFQRGEKSSDDG